MASLQEPEWSWRNAFNFLLFSACNCKCTNSCSKLHPTGCRTSAVSWLWFLVLNSFKAHLFNQLLPFSLWTLGYRLVPFFVKCAPLSLRCYWHVFHSPVPCASWRVPLMNCPSLFALSLVLSASCPVCSPSAVTLVAWRYRLKKSVINEHDKETLQLSESTWKPYRKQMAINELLISYTGSVTHTFPKYTITFYYFYH